MNHSCQLLFCDGPLLLATQLYIHWLQTTDYRLLTTDSYTKHWAQRRTKCRLNDYVLRSAGSYITVCMSVCLNTSYSIVLYIHFTHNIIYVIIYMTRSRVTRLETRDGKLVHVALSSAMYTFAYPWSRRNLWDEAEEKFTTLCYPRLFPLYIRRWIKKFNATGLISLLKIY